ncbi:MAG: lysozyme inhibitor LprI family protein [Novosphingobium sp.]
MSLIILAAALAAPSINCAKTSAQAELNECALADLTKADAALNDQWEITFRAFANQSPDDASRLRTAQRAWIVYRDAECDAEHPFDIGVSLDKMLNIFCRTDLTIERTRTLAELPKDL